MKNLKISNIPIYRAKKIDSDEYVEGYLISHYIFKEWIDDFWTSYGETMSNKAEVYNIDVSTLAIHFPDMLDSQENKIFASLQEDGKGGDIVYYKSKIDLVTKTTVYFENYRLITHSKGENTFRDKESLSKFEIIGIKE